MHTCNLRTPEEERQAQLLKAIVLGRQADLSSFCHRIHPPQPSEGDPEKARWLSFQVQRL